MSKSTVEHWMLGKGHDDAFVDHVRKQVDTAPAKTMARRMREIIQLDATGDLQDVRCPVLYLQATRDRIVPPRCGKVIKEHCSDCRMASLPGTHLILQTHAAQAWEQIADFASS